MEHEGRKLAWAYLTDVGLKRETNEDAALALSLNLDVHSEQNTIGLFVVSDGMGGKERGEIASKITVKTLGEAFTGVFLRPALARVTEVVNYGSDETGTEPETATSPAAFLTETIREANRRIRHLKRNGNRINLGATVTAGILTDDLLTLGHVGDSRCYLFYDNHLRQLTQDHSMVNEMVKKGLLSSEEGRQHPQRNVLARALGSQEDVQVDTTASVLQAGCKILLCSDGLHSMVEEETIQRVLAQPDHPRELVEILIREANAGGGKDNITAMIVQFL